MSLDSKRAGFERAGHRRPRCSARTFYTGWRPAARRACARSAPGRRPPEHAPSLDRRHLRFSTPGHPGGCEARARNRSVRLSRVSIQGIILQRFEFGSHRLAQITPPRSLRQLAKAFGRGGREAALVGLAAAALFLALAISSYHRGDPSWSVRNGSEHVVNRGGLVGAWISDLVLQLFGHVAWILPFLLVVVGIVLFLDRERSSTRLARMTRGIGFAMVLMAACGIATLHYGNAGTLPEGIGAGGILGAVVGHAFLAAFNFLGATVVMLGLLFAGWALFTKVSWLTVMETTGRLVLSLFAALAGLSGRRRARREVSHARREREQTVAARTRRNPQTQPAAAHRAGVDRDRAEPASDPGASDRALRAGGPPAAGTRAAPTNPPTGRPRCRTPPSRRCPGRWRSSCTTSGSTSRWWPFIPGRSSPVSSCSRRPA